jgi:uridine kinase
VQLFLPGGLAQTVTERGRVLEALADRIAGIRRAHPVRVAIDGVDGAGKTTLADELAEPVSRRGRPVVRVSIDHFHHPREVRYRQGRASPRGYFEDSFDLAALLRCVLEPLGPGGSRRVRRRAFDHRTDSPVESPLETVPEDAVLLLDGIFLQRPELRSHFDLAIFLDVSFEETTARQLVRNGADPDAGAESNRRYVGGQRLYLAQCDPRARADLVVDNESWRAPRIVRDGAAPR